jgi:predicted dehydrogenase
VKNLAVIGCGHWGPNHIRTFNALPGAHVEIVVDQDEKRLARVIEQFPGTRCERNHQVAFEDPMIDAVVVVTPTATHYQLVRDALLAGKNVLCEKPLAETGEQAEELVALARSAQRVLMVGHIFLFNGGIIKLKELCETGEVGKPQYLAASRTNLGPIRSDVNAAYDLATHDISIFNWLLNSEPEVISATGQAFLQPGIEDVVFLTMKYPSGVIASIRASWLDPKKVRQITIVGSKRMATWDDLDLTSPIAIYDKGAAAEQDYNDYGEFLRVSMWDGDVRLPKIALEEPLRAQGRHFLQAIEGGTFRSDGPFAAGVVRTLEAAAKSLAQGGAPMRLSG